jgi:ubiquinone/menaquinone biosynthesis C-methylase UbiE
MKGTPLAREVFTDLAPRYEQIMDRELGRFLSVGYADFIERLLAFAPIQADDLVLDMATGTARLPRALVERSQAGRGIVGLDITPSMLEHARDRCLSEGSASRIHLVCASGTAIALATCTFDAVVCGFGTHHMHVPSMLSEMRRVLKNGGWLVLAEAVAPASWRAWWGRVFLGLSLHVYGLMTDGARARAEIEAVSNLHTGSEWRVLLSAAGFTAIEVREERGRRVGYPHAVLIRAVAG